jgi:cellulose synthase/poly-beta-1,6-N-acetylglucosamine synthase-like glycosyltransferase
MKMFAGWRTSMPRLRLLGDSAPSVDIIITCCGEQMDILIDTIRATCVLDYPPDRFRVIVSDDANDPELSKFVESIRIQYTNVIYTARKVGKNHGYKAGNLNHGLAIVENLAGGPGEYVASLDSDMIPQPGWLRALIPHLALNPRVAMVSPPQVRLDIHLYSRG